MRSFVLVISRALVPALYVACAAPPSATPLSSSAPEHVHTTGCITQSAASSPPRADSIAIAGDRVSLCFGAPPERSCWRVDAATRELESLAVTPPRAERPAKAVVRPNGTIELCGPGGSPCTLVANPDRTKTSAWVSDDLSTLAIPDSATLRVYDVASGKLRATIPGWPDSPMAGDAFNYPPTFATPDRMIVWYAWTPVSEQGRIFDMAGKQLAIVGNDFWAMDPDTNAWRIHGSEWAIMGEATSMLTVDVEHPSETREYELSPLFALPRPDDDHQLLNLLAVAGTAKRLIIVTGENPVTIGVIDRATNTLEKLEPPRCPPAKSTRAAWHGE